MDSALTRGGRTRLVGGGPAGNYVDWRGEHGVVECPVPECVWVPAGPDAGPEYPYGVCILRPDYMDDDEPWGWEPESDEGTLAGKVGGGEGSGRWLGTPS